MGLLHLLDVRQLCRIELPGGLVGLLGQQRAALIDHAHVFYRQIGQAARHQVGDAGDLGPFQALAGIQGYQHRGGRLLLLAHEDRRPGNRQVHACRLHRAQRLDRFRQLTFQSALIVDLLLKLGGAEFLVVDQLEARGSALGQALRRQLQARLVHQRCRDHDRAAAVGDPVGNVLLVERGDDGAAVLVGDLREQDFVVRRLTPHPGGGQYRDGRGRSHHGGQLVARRQCAPACEQGRRHAGARHRQGAGGIECGCVVGHGLRFTVQAMNEIDYAKPDGAQTCENGRLCPAIRGVPAGRLRLTFAHVMNAFAGRSPCWTR